MKHSKLFIFAIMTTLAVSGCKHQAATYPTDTLTTKNGSQLTITFFKHASLAIETEGRHIYIDPISQCALGAGVTTLCSMARSTTIWKFAAI